MQKNKIPLISIAIPTFNEEEDLENCLNSIIKQDLANKIEVIIVDDDSTDNTLKIARSYSTKLNIKIMRNGTKNAERGKKIALDNCDGEFFMYLDADMQFRDKNWFSETIRPLLDNKKIVGSIASFGVNPKDNALTRCISYDVFQRDPIFIAFTPSIRKTIIKENENYFLCQFSHNKIPAQSLCLYRKEVIQKVFKKYEMLMDNDIPVVLVKEGYDLFAFCPQVRVYHFLLKNLKELVNKRIRGATKSYMNNLPKREYKWLNLDNKKNILLLGIWVLYANLFFPALIYGLYKTVKFEDLACMYEPLITIVSTDSLIYGFFKSGSKLWSL